MMVNPDIWFLVGVLAVVLPFWIMLR